MSVSIRFHTEFHNDFDNLHGRIYYVPTTEEQEADLTSIAYVRQNAWKKEVSQRSPAIVGLLSLPYAHTKRDVEEYRRTSTIRESQAKLVADLPTGSLVFIPDGRDGSLVRLVSEVKTGILPLKLVRRERTCGHSYTEASSTCEACGNSVVCVGDMEDPLGQGYILEPFYSLYRECDIVGRIKIPPTWDLRTLASQNVAGKKTLFWKRVEPIAE